jgi:protoporphyrinogen oxidase
MHNKIILGAGPSGLAYQLFDKNKNILLEKNSHAGGHASSYFIDGFTFDYGPHILFSKDKEILKFIVDSLGSNVGECKRNNKISYKDKLIKYPFENDLSSLDPQDNYECISNFIYNPYAKIKHPKNMKEWFLKNFGAGIAEKYLIP